VPASFPQPEVAPVIEEPILSEVEGTPSTEESPAHPIEETPAKPKRTPRKVAKK